MISSYLQLDKAKHGDMIKALYDDDVITDF